MAECLLQNTRTEGEIVYFDGEITLDGLDEEQQAFATCDVPGCNAELELSNVLPDGVVTDLNMDSVKTAAFICKMSKE